jgi:hypothetical protein
MLVVVTVVMIGSCATSQNPDKMVFERFCGTWANQDYQPKPAVMGPPPFAKWILNPDGTMVMYEFLIQTRPTHIKSYTVEKRWADSEDNHFYHMKAYDVLHQVTQYELWRLSKYNAVLEVQYIYNDYSAKIDLEEKHSDYIIY